MEEGGISWDTANYLPVAAAAKAAAGDGVLPNRWMAVLQSISA